MYWCFPTKQQILMKSLKLDNKMECYAERCVFITLKDHKENCTDY